jgi:hypothetical protein
MTGEEFTKELKIRGNDLTARETILVIGAWKTSRTSTLVDILDSIDERKDLSPPLKLRFSELVHDMV